MFGFSLTKLLFTVFVVLLVWNGYKWINRVQALRRQRDRDNFERASSSAAKAARPSAIDAEDMVKCPVCGDFVPALGPLSCGRPDCPYPG